MAGLENTGAHLLQFVEHMRGQLGMGSQEWPNPERQGFPVEIRLDHAADFATTELLAELRFPRVAPPDIKGRKRFRLVLVPIAFALFPPVPGRLRTRVPGSVKSKRVEPAFAPGISELMVAHPRG